MKKLPARSPQSLPESRPGNVRERTLAHLKDLLRNTTKMGASIALVCGVAGQGCKHMVVDPPPPPPPGACANPDTLKLEWCVKPDAIREKSGRKWTINLNLRVQWGVDNMSFEGLTKDDVHVAGVSVKSLNVGRQNVEIVLAPYKGRADAELDLAVRCNNTSIPYRLKLDLSKPRKKKGNVPTELVQ